LKDIAELTRIRSKELRRGSPCLSSLQPRWAGSPLRCDKLQGITTAKANKKNARPENLRPGIVLLYLT
jgi:hypothetical protein